MATLKERTGKKPGLGHMVSGRRISGGADVDARELALSTRMSYLHPELSGAHFVAHSSIVTTVSS